MAATPTVTAQQPVAPLPLTVATVQTGEETTVASTVAAMARHRTRVTADERDADEREKHRESKAKEPLHH